jgi:hypothetical protein
MPSLLETLRDFFEIGRAIIPGSAESFSSRETGAPSTGARRAITPQAEKSAEIWAILDEGSSQRIACRLQLDRQSNVRGRRA